MRVEEEREREVCVCMCVCVCNRVNSEVDLRGVTPVLFSNPLSKDKTKHTEMNTVNTHND